MNYGRVFIPDLRYFSLGANKPRKEPELNSSCVTSPQMFKSPPIFPFSLDFDYLEPI